MVRNIPAGVKVISAAYTLAAIFAVFIGIGRFFRTESAVVEIEGFIPGAGQGVYFALGTLSFISAIFGVLVAIGLWMGKKWARIIGIVLSILLLMGAILLIFQQEFFAGFVGLIINSIIGSYLLFSDRVKESFR